MVKRGLLISSLRMVNLPTTNHRELLYTGSRCVCQCSTASGTHSRTDEAMYKESDSSTSLSLFLLPLWTGSFASATPSPLTPSLLELQSPFIQQSFSFITTRFYAYVTNRLSFRTLQHNQDVGLVVLYNEQPVSACSKTLYYFFPSWSIYSVQSQIWSLPSLWLPGLAACFLAVSKSTFGPSLLLSDEVSEPSGSSDMFSPPLLTYPSSSFTDQ